jgi:hypothetical protein
MADKRSNSYRRYTAIALIAALSCCLAIKAATVRADARPDVCHLFTPDAEYVENVIDMQLEKVAHRLRIPKVYYEDPWDWADGARHTSQLIRVTVDDFVPVFRPMTLTFNKAGRRDGYFRFLIGDHVRFERLLEIQFSYASPGSENQPTDAIRTSSDFGLTALVPSDGKVYRDLFLGETEQGSDPSILVCNKQETSLFPQCRHYVRLHEMDFIISYDRHLLAHWRELETKVSDFIGCATQSSD